MRNSESIPNDANSFAPRSSCLGPGIRKKSDIARIFRFAARYDLNLSRDERRLVWERYWRYLDTRGVAMGSTLERYFVQDVFQHGHVICRSLNLTEKVFRLSIENTQAMNKVHDDHGDQWACSHIVRSDFVTRVVFHGVDSLNIRLGNTQRKRRYQFSEISACGKRFQIIMHLSDVANVETYMWLSFDTVTVEDISSRLKKYLVPLKRPVKPMKKLEEFLLRSTAT